MALDEIKCPHSLSKLMVSCLCYPPHECAECAHPHEYDKEFMDMLKECAKKSNEDQRKTVRKADLTERLK